MTYRRAPLDEVRALIARHLLERDETIPARLGRIELRPHQRTAAARLTSLLATNGGAMLAEPVGLGKTYIALAVASRLRESILIAVPASLRTMWNEALAECSLSATIVSHEALSRGERPRGDAGVVIVDEAHRLRSPATRRYAALAACCRRAKVLLVTATPVQNRRADLAVQLALFLGRVAFTLSDDELAEHVVREDVREHRDLPRLDGPHRIVLPIHDDCLDALVSLPPPVPARDESVATALLTYGLVHQWASSRAALIASLTRRRARAVALLAAVGAGRRPSRSELSAWTHHDDAVQLAFPELVADETPTDPDDLGLLAVAIHRHDEAVDALIRRLRASDNPDAYRARALLDVRAKHPGERIIAFCQYMETVHALRMLLAREPGIASLTSRGGRIASGQVSREEIIAQFTPRAEHVADERAAQRIELLITTDLLSEGLNLQEASVIVHLDLPWNPARLDQRVGRVRRLGSRHGVVTVYAVAPPAPAEHVLRIEARLREKLSIAQRTIGVAGRILPSPLGVSTDSERGLAERVGAVQSELRTWLTLSDVDGDRNGVQISAVASTTSGFLALVHDGDTLRLVCDLGAGIEVEASAIERAVVACDAAETSPSETRIMSVLDAIRTWLAGRAAAAMIDFRAANAASARRAALTRVAQSVARAPRHQRARLAPLAAAARAVATASLGEGAERILEMLVESELPDEAWLRSLVTFGELNARPPATSRAGVGGSRIVAVILLTPD